MTDLDLFRAGHGTLQQEDTVLVRDVGTWSVRPVDVAGLPLAERADAVVLGSHEPTEADVKAFWADVAEIVAEMSQSAGRWQRLRGRFSVRSFKTVRVSVLPGSVTGAVGRLPSAVRRVPAVLGRVRARPFRGDHR